MLPNSFETAWNFETPFYRKEDGSMRMVYVYFHKPICPRDFSMTIYSFRWIWVVDRWLGFSFLIRYVGQSKHGPGHEGNSPIYNIIKSAAAASTAKAAAEAAAIAALLASDIP